MSPQSHRIHLRQLRVPRRRTNEPCGQLFRTFCYSHCAKRGEALLAAKCLVVVLHHTFYPSLHCLDIRSVQVTILALIRFSLRKQLSFRDAITVFPRNDVWGSTSAEIPHWWRVTNQIWIVLPIGRGTTNQKYYPNLGSDTSSVWNFCRRSSGVISRETALGRHEMSVVFSG